MTHLRLEYKSTQTKTIARQQQQKWQIKRLKKMASLISFHCVCQKVRGWETLSLFHCSSVAAGRGGDDHLLSTVAETRHELVSVSFLHIYKASNVCVSLFEKKGDTKIYHCAKPLVVYKRRPGTGLFFPPRDFVVRSPRGRPFGPALDQFRYYRVERKLATHPNVLTTSFRYGDKSSGVDTTQGCRNLWCRE